jgi:CheY-like chemotaxis protein
VLVVDDNCTSARSLTGLLSAWGVQALPANSAQRALELIAEARENGSPFPLVLLDAYMPEMDGFALSARMRQDPATVATAIILMTPANRVEDALRCHELGIAQTLTKPVRRSELRSAIVNGLHGLSRTHPERNESWEAARGKNLRVLVAEDNAVNQQLARRILEKRGHTVLTAWSGREALAILNDHPVDVILMDLQMPEMDGFAATAAIREREKATGGHQVIIAATAHAMEGDKDKCLAAGMDGYIQKPIQLQALIHAVESANASGRRIDLSTGNSHANRSRAPIEVANS